MYKDAVDGLGQFVDHILPPLMHGLAVHEQDLLAPLPEHILAVHGLVVLLVNHYQLVNVLPIEYQLHHANNLVDHLLIGGLDDHLPDLSP